MADTQQFKTTVDDVKQHLLPFQEGLDELKELDSKISKLSSKQRTFSEEKELRDLRDEAKFVRGKLPTIGEELKPSIKKALGKCSTPSNFIREQLSADEELASIKQDITALLGQLNQKMTEYNQMASDKVEQLIDEVEETGYFALFDKLNNNGVYYFQVNGDYVDTPLILRGVSYNTEALKQFDRK